MIAPWSRRLFRVVIVLIAITSAVLIRQVYRHVQAQREVIREAAASAKAQSTQAAAAIDAEIRGIMPITQAMADDLSGGRLSEENLPARLEAVLRETPHAFEAGVAYVPFQKDPAVRLYAPHAKRIGSEIKRFQLEESYDYTEFDWYKEGIAAPCWCEPYFGEATKSLVVGYVVPFRRPGAAAGSGAEGDVPIGVVRVNLSLDGVRKIISRVNLGKTGYGFLLSKKGVYLSDPVEDYVRRQRTIFDVAKERGDEARMEIGNKAIRGERAFVESVSSVTGQPTWIFAEPIPSAGWSLGAVFIKDEISLAPSYIRHGMIKIACEMIALLALISLLTSRAYQGGQRNLWTFGATVSVLMSAGISFIWYLTWTIPDPLRDGGVRVIDKEAVHKYIAASSPAEGARAPIKVPTGVLLSTFRFSGANDVVVTGYIWQRHTEENAGAMEGFVLPDAESADIKEAYRHRTGGVEIIGYSVKATLRQSFADTVKYPFDRAVAKVRIWPKDFNANVLLTPDFDAYPLISPTALPGIDRTLVTPGWKPEGSYFSYTPARYSATFGLDGRAGREGWPELSYNLELKRQLLNPFISTLLPIVVVACLLFALLYVGTKIKEKVAATGFKATDVVRASVSLLFPVLIAQINLRSKIAASGLIYMEYLYFVMYTTILFVSANALEFTMRDRGLLQLRDNGIPKLLYWPALLGICFTITLIFLY